MGVEEPSTMHADLTRRSILAGAIAMIATKSRAAPRPYELIADRSEVKFSFSVNGLMQSGTVPVRTADIRVDTRNLAASTAEVTADVREAKTGLIFITQALQSEDILYAEKYPIVSFTSTAIRLGARGRISEGARIEGHLTLRGITRDVSLDALLSRPAGTPPDDLSVLYVRLSGTLSRRDFGATGYAGMVDDEVRLNIRTEIRAKS